MKSINQLEKRLGELEQEKDPQKFCLVATPEELAAMPESEKSQYQIVMIVPEELKNI